MVREDDVEVKQGQRVEDKKSSCWFVTTSCQDLRLGFYHEPTVGLCSGCIRFGKRTASSCRMNIWLDSSAIIVGWQMKQ